MTDKFVFLHNVTFISKRMEYIPLCYKSLDNGLKCLDKTHTSIVTESRSKQYITCSTPWLVRIND